MAAPKPSSKTGRSPPHTHLAIPSPPEPKTALRAPTRIKQPLRIVAVLVAYRRGMARSILDTSYDNSPTPYRFGRRAPHKGCQSRYTLAPSAQGAAPSPQAGPHQHSQGGLRSPRQTLYLILDDCGLLVATTAGLFTQTEEGHDDLSSQAPTQGTIASGL
jgi:hypothetical protein